MYNGLVSIITINYNQAELTCKLIDSLRKCSYQNFEVIVVDNASTNDNPEIIREQNPDVLLIKSSENLGFSGGNNLGIQWAKGEYCLFINNDVSIISGRPILIYFTK